MPGFNICGSGGEVSATTEVYRSYRWDLHQLAGPIAFDRQELSMALDFSVPSIDFEVLKIQGMSLEYKVPQKPIFNNIDITFYDIYGIQSKFEQWTDKIWNPLDGLYEGQAPTNIKGKIELFLLNYDGTQGRQYKLYGAWPKRISHSKLSMSDDTIKTLVVEFVFDYYVQEDIESP